MRLLILASFTVVSYSLFADILTIISPHRKSIQKEFVAAFEDAYVKQYGTKVKVDWIDQGGTESDVRYVQSKFAGGNKTSGIDIFWGGGEMAFEDLLGQGLLESYLLPESLNKEIPDKIAGLPVKEPKGLWYGTALSSFGIFFNKKLLSKIPQPAKWADLADPQYFEQISMADPRHSGSALVMYMMIIEAFGWDKGWELLTAMAANTKKFSHSSSDPIKAVVSGDVAIATAVDFYAYPQIESIGSDNLGFVLPANETAYNSDPVAILKGAPNRQAAERFVNFLLSKEAQKLFILPKGVQGGPVFATLGRMGVNTKAYEEIRNSGLKVFEPFTMADNKFNVDLKKLSLTKNVFADFFGTVLVDNHRGLAAAWKHEVVSKKVAVSDFAKSMLTESELVALAPNWLRQDRQRNDMINKWLKKSKENFQIKDEQKGV